MTNCTSVIAIPSHVAELLITPQCFRECLNHIDAILDERLDMEAQPSLLETLQDMDTEALIQLRQAIRQEAEAVCVHL